MRTHRVGVQAELDRRVRQPRGCRPHRDFREESVVAARRFPQDHGHDFLDGRPGPATLSKGAASAEHQQTAAAVGDEVRDHLKLIVREERGLHAPENQRAIPVQLLATGGKAEFELGAVGDLEA